MGFPELFSGKFFGVIIGVVDEGWGATSASFKGKGNASIVEITVDKLSGFVFPVVVCLEFRTEGLDSGETLLSF